MLYTHSSEGTSQSWYGCVSTWSEQEVATICLCFPCSTYVLWSILIPTSVICSYKNALNCLSASFLIICCMWLMSSACRLACSWKAYFWSNCTCDYSATIYTQDYNRHIQGKYFKHDQLCRRHIKYQRKFCWVIFNVLMQDSLAFSPIGSSDHCMGSSSVPHPNIMYAMQSPSVLLLLKTLSKVSDAIALKSSKEKLFPKYPICFSILYNVSWSMGTKWRLIEHIGARFQVRIVACRSSFCWLNSSTAWRCSFDAPRSFL